MKRDILDQETKTKKPQQIESLFPIKRNEVGGISDSPDYGWWIDSPISVPQCANAKVANETEILN